MTNADYLERIRWPNGFICRYSSATAGSPPSVTARWSNGWCSFTRYRTNRNRSQSAQIRSSASALASVSALVIARHLSL